MESELLSSFIKEVFRLGVRDVIVGGVAVIGTLLWGRGGRKKLIARIDALEVERKQPPVNVIIGDILGEVAIQAGKDHPEQIARKDMQGNLYLGTKNGTMRVSLKGGQETAKDLIQWLHKVNLLAVLDEDNDET